MGLGPAGRAPSVEEGVIKDPSPYLSQHREWNTWSKHFVYLDRNFYEYVIDFKSKLGDKIWYIYRLNRAVSSYSDQRPKYRLGVRDR